MTLRPGASEVLSPRGGSLMSSKQPGTRVSNREANNVCSNQSSPPPILDTKLVLSADPAACAVPARDGVDPAACVSPARDDVDPAALILPLVRRPP